MLWLPDSHSFEGGWSAAVSDTNQYITILFDDYDYTTVTSLYTQGHKTNSEWVTSYKIQFFNLDDQWETITKDGSDAIFQVH